LPSDNVCASLLRLKRRTGVAISVSIDLTPEEKQQLATILGATEANLETVLKPYVAAASEEYVRMFLGQRVFTRGSDAREFRLLLLIKHAFKNRFPDDQRISDLFQTTLSESRSLIKSVTAKYQYELAGAKEATLRTVLESAQQQENDVWLLSINSRTVVEQLNRDLVQLGADLPPIRLKENTGSTYVMAPSSYDRLRQKYQ
jgi:hypothetical protein